MATSRQLLIFDDGRGRFGPLTDLRAVFDLRTAAATTRWRIEKVLGLTSTALHVPAPMLPLVSARYDLGVNYLPEDNTPAGWWVVNGRWAGARAAADVMALTPGSALIQPDGQLVAACVDHAAARSLIDNHFNPTRDLRVVTLDRNILLERPWHILDQLDDTFEKDSTLIDLPTWTGRDAGVFVEYGHPVKVARDATVRPGVVIDSTKGPVYINAHASISPMVTIEGPCYIGSGAVISPHAAIRPNTVIGPSCKVGGEISCSIIHGHTNKAHAGFLGHALVGQWVNLGADTTVSNLKNTYSNVRVQLTPEGEAEDTDRMFQGPIIGDFVRTAIGTRLNTGSVVGTGAMLALSGFAPKHSRGFTFHTDAGPEPYDIDRFIATARIMMSRRQIEPDPAELEHWRSLATRLHGITP